jgi:ankyrin repeat protein
VGLGEGKEDVVLFLIKDYGWKFEFNRRNDKGDTPLMIAIFRKMHKAVRLLVEKCDINGCDFKRNTPFIAAAANGDI